MRYDISKASAPKMPPQKRDKKHLNPALKGLKRHTKPLVPILFASLCAHISVGEIQCLDHK